MNSRKLRGLYAITAQDICTNEVRLLTAVESALKGGAALIQYRDKTNDVRTRALHARSLLKLCRSYGAALIINDNAALAADIGADGVHLGASDGALADARMLLGSAAIIGVTCSNSLPRALAAQSGGADYIALGRFFASRTKPDAPPATLEFLQQVREAVPQLPICVIGGLTPHNAAPLIQHGANLVAAVEGIFGAADIQGAAREYSRLFA